ncbi:precorrin-3B synthase [Microvirga makkahensis]|uniref:Precorrin-3B synthase n=1 Tax=Microvirga makkahensis TaxID=1128670 RepID=A0A7X3SR91_9HYPH|nr:precorrin-3B synthase [Microvirga makkahensis]MXQ13909.1 precorrin-3B synthase [Microvirga makkahensis]
MTTSSRIMRKGWCPGVRRPMATGDGLLVRLHPPAGRLTAAQVRLIAEAARQHGNGHLDITARGNLQIRGVRDESYPALMTLLNRVGLTEPEGDGPYRVTMVSPLAGVDMRERFDALALAQAIEEKARSITGLPAKFFIAIDGGGLLPLDTIGADLHLAALDDGNAVAFGLSSLNGLQWIGATDSSRATETAVTILSGYAEMRDSGRSEARRLRDLHPNMVGELADKAALGPAAAASPRNPAPRAGILDVVGAKAVLLALPFGRCKSPQLEQAAEWSEQFGTGEIRLSFTRGILLPGVAEKHLAELLQAAAQSGFIIEADDHRLSLAACPGKPDCASARTPAPDDALELAHACEGLLSQGFTLHVSGCPKGCAHPGKADLTLVGRDDGRYDVVPNGTPRETASHHLSVEELMTRLLPLNTVDDLSRAFAENVR